MKLPSEMEPASYNPLLSDQSHRRYNPLTGEWILVSPHRTKRPWQGKQENAGNDERPSYDEKCYLCPGNERNGGEINPAYTETFVFQNDFAAILPTHTTDDFQDDLLQATGEKGICKVICFSPDHSLTMPEMTVEALTNVVNVWQEQFNELAAQDFIHNVQIFENKGAIMGCSNPHPHGQIWAQSAVPQEISKKTAAQEAYYAKHGKSLISRYLEQELEKKERIVCENEHFVGVVPFWAVWPYETMLIPRRHFASIADMSAAEKQSFADLLKEVTVRYDNLFETSFPYSAGMQQRPTDGKPHEGWHFHYSFYPPLLRSATVKKFMVGYEMFANPQRDITAEQAAKTLRDLPSVHYKVK